MPVRRRRKPFHMYDDKMVKDVVRLEIAALLSHARQGHTDFMADILEKATPTQRSVIRKELKTLEQMLRTKAEAVDEA